MPVKNICPCDLPPGGQTICEPHQLAVCAVANGIANKQCIDPPATNDILALCNWALSSVTGVVRNYNDAINAQEIQMLLSEHFTIGNQKTSFRLPLSLKIRIVQLIQTGQQGMFSEND